MKLLKMKIILFVLCFNMVLLSSCSSTKLEEENIKIGLMSDTAAIPFIVAEEKGFFEQQGLTVHIHVFFSALDRDAALQANALNAVSSDLISVGLLKEAGSKIKIISKTETEYKIVASPDAQVHTIQEFNHKKIGLSTNTLMEYLVDEAIKYYHLSEVEKVNIPKMPTRLEMLRNNQLHGAILPEPLATIASNSNSKVLASNKDLNLYPGVLLFNETFVTDHGNTMNKFIQAYNDSVDYINAHGISEFKNDLVESLSFPEEATLSDLEFEHMTLPTDSDIQSAMQWLFEKELIKTTYTSNELLYDILTQ
ncbi:MAG: ABC transporter substrate-binding protein [Eubacteriales bacterium]